MSDYSKQASDIQLRMLQNLAAYPDVVAAIDAAGASVPALVATAEADLAARLGVDTGRTSTLQREYAPHVSSQARAMQYGGASSPVAAYPVLDGAPVGSVQTLRGMLREQHAAADEARATGNLTRRQTRNQRRNGRR